MKQPVAMIILFIVTMLGLFTAFAQATDARPTHGTIKCRDAQIKQLNKGYVDITVDPFNVTYEESDRAVNEILDTAEQLYLVCK